MPKKKADPAESSQPQHGADPGHQIWLAGLGALSQAQKKGSEALQKMLQDGLDLQRQAQQTAEQKIADASEKMGAMARQLAQGKPPIDPVKAMPWDTLEGLFEQRVLQALLKQGWATPGQFKELLARVATLEQQMASTLARRTTGRPASPARPSRPSRPD